MLSVNNFLKYNLNSDIHACGCVLRCGTFGFYFKYTLCRDSTNNSEVICLFANSFFHPRIVRGRHERVARASACIVMLAGLFLCLWGQFMLKLGHWTQINQSYRLSKTFIWRVNSYPSLTGKASSPWEAAHWT